MTPLNGFFCTVKGEMTAFGEKFSQSDVDALIAFLHALDESSVKLI